MNKLAFKVGTALATISLLATSAMPAFAAKVVIKGNGAFSTNKVNVTKTKNVTLTQTNTAVFINLVNANSNTGGNTTSFNTGGDTLILTGESNTSVTVTNVANSNVIN